MLDSALSCVRGLHRFRGAPSGGGLDMGTPRRGAAGRTTTRGERAATSISSRSVGPAIQLRTARLRPSQSHWQRGSLGLSDSFIAFLFEG